MTPESCDWCGRPGRVIQHDIVRAGVLVCRDPCLCEVCLLLFEADAFAVRDAFEELLDPNELNSRFAAFEAQLMRAWREKVAAGVRSAESVSSEAAVAFEVEPEQ